HPRLPTRLRDDRHMADMEFPEIHAALSRPETAAGLTRRRFLQAALAGSAVVAATPWMEKVAWATTPVGAHDGILVVIQLGGGNDGLNTVVPTGDSNYYSQRGPLAISAASALDLGSGVGLHPNLGGLKARYDA